MGNLSARSRRRFLGGGLALAGAGLLSACGGESGDFTSPGGLGSNGSPGTGGPGGPGGPGTESGALDRLRAAGEVRIGIADELPYAGIQDGRGIGLMPSLHTEIYQRLQVPTLTYVALTWDVLLPAVQAGEIDMVGAGMFVTADRCEQAQPGDVEVLALSGLLVAKGNPGRYTDVESVLAEDGKLVVVAGSVEETAMHDLGVLPEFATNYDDMLSMVAEGRADAGVGDSLALRWLADGNTDIELGEPFQLNAEESSAAQGSASFFHQEDTDLVAAFNGHLADIKDDGTMLALGAEWGLTEAEVPPADLLVDQLCG